MKGEPKGDTAVAKDLTPDPGEELWGAIEPHLPVRPTYHPKGGPPFCEDRPCLPGTLPVWRGGGKGQSIPCESLGCPSGPPCWRRFQEWTATGVWANAHLQLLDLLGEE